MKEYRSVIIHHNRKYQSMYSCVNIYWKDDVILLEIIPSQVESLDSEWRGKSKRERMEKVGALTVVGLCQWLSNYVSPNTSCRKQIN